MGFSPIAELRPELPSLETKQIRAVVTLIWPYSSSARQFALLLAEPNIRLRRRNGQVRARFYGSSARAMASTGIGIGDEVVLSLRGASFVRDNTVSTPGKSIDYELEYTQTVSVQINRNGTELATLDLTDVAPTPANRSPVRPTPHKPNLSAIEEPAKWASPAFLKRMRLSDGPVFEAGYDPFTDDIEDGHANKRRRKSYRDWNAWTYSARTPSPEKEDEISEDSDALYASPTRPTKALYTSVSPPKPEKPLDATSQPQQNDIIDLSDDEEDDEEDDDDTDDQISEEEIRVQDTDIRKSLDGLADGPFEPDPDDHNLHIGSDERMATSAHAVSSSQQNDGSLEHGIQRDTVPFDQVARADMPDIITLEESDEDEDEQNSQAASTAELEVVAPDEEEHRAEDVGETDVPMGAQESIGFEFGVPVNTNETVSTEAPPTFEWTENFEVPEIVDDNQGPVGMAPPMLPLLQTDFPTTPAPGMLTPIGHEPRSPNLRPLDSSTLPMPSPFPDEQEGSLTSYLEHAGQSQLGTRTEIEEEEVSHNVDAVDASFYSSISSSKAPAFHESAFSDVRFTFGLDGSAFSSMLPSPETHNAEDEHDDQELNQKISTVAQEHGANERGGAAQRTNLEPTSAEIAQTEVHEPNTGTTDFAVESMTAEQGTEYRVDVELPSSDQVDLLEQSQTESRDEPKNRDESEALITTHVEDSDRDVRDVRPEEHIPSALTDIESQQIPAIQDVHSPARDADAPTAPIEITEVIDLGSSDESDEEEFLEDATTNEPQPAENEPKSTIAAARDHMGQEEDKPEDRDPDIKIESIEEDGTLHSTRQEASSKETEDRESGDPEGESPEKMLIEIPDGEKVGENHVVAVPATAPARNTRSKTKLMSSPETSVTHRTPRTHRVRPSLDSIAQTARSPSATRSTFATSPTPSSPYNLRSHSKPYSPAKDRTMEQTPTKSRKRAAQRESVGSVENNSQIAPNASFDSTDLDLPHWNFGPSQELGASQGKFSNVAYVKDSEEGSLHSENSLSTVQYSDEWTVIARSFTDDRQSEEPRTDLPDRNSAGKAPEPANDGPSDMGSSQPEAKPGSASQSFSKTTSDVVGTPRRSRRLNKDVSDFSTDNDEVSEGPTPKRVPGDLRSTLNEEGEGGKASSPPTTQTRTRSANHQSIAESNTLVTPETTQKTSASQLPVPAAQQEPTMPITPQLTQTTSAGLRSFKTPDEADTETEKTVVREDTITTEPTSPSTSPSEHSSNASITAVDATSTAPTVATPKPEPPSIGLSTPIAYYTPLKDLPFFLNRSSQFHSSSHPDVLALVTSRATPPQKAPKGPRHHHTTFHITDLSSYPATTTVQVFRPYATALPVADVGDVVLLRAFAVKSLNRRPQLVSAEDSAWCVWRYSKLLWGKGRGEFAEVKAREEVLGPGVESGEGEWREVKRLRAWFLGGVKGELEERERVKEEEGKAGVVTRGMEKRDGSE